MTEPREAIFLDRDGTIVEDLHYPRDPSKIVLTPNAAAGMRLMQAKGYLLFVVSNQSGVGRGIIKDFEFRAVHEKVVEILKTEKIEIAEFAYCLHRPDDNCNCRKPRPGLIAKKFNDAPIDLKKSFVIGDKDCDVELADAVGATGILVLTGKGQKTREEMQARGTNQYQTTADLLTAAQLLP